jgi:hypothetical protein
VNTGHIELKTTGTGTLPDLGLRAISTQAALLALAAVVLPALSHLAGLPVRWLLPMHWAVLLAGLTYGWRSGAVIGLLAPSASFLLSGMPLPQVLPAMTLELAAYGLVAGLARQVWRWSGTTSTVLAIVAGRAVFAAMAFVTGYAGRGAAVDLGTVLLPGLIAAVAQVLLLPVVARWWVLRERRN